MAENYKHLYEQTKKMLTMYQDELIPGFRKQIEELEAKNKWIPVTERLPIGIGGELSEIVIVRTVDGEVTTGWVNPNAWWLIKGDNDYPTRQEHGYVTHWMPLPEPPKEV